MWKNKETHIYDIYKNHSQDDLVLNPTTTTTIRNYKSQHLYPGSDFDVFGKEEEGDQPQQEEIMEAPFSAIKKTDNNINETKFKTLKHHTKLIKDRKQHVEQKSVKTLAFWKKRRQRIHRFASMFKNKDNNVNNNDFPYY